VEYIFKKILSDTDIEQIESFYNSLDHAPIEQHPLWFKTVEPKDVNYFIAYENTEVVCYSVLIEKKIGPLKFAEIHFGPLFQDPEHLISSLIAITKYYRKKLFLYLTVQLARITDATTDYIEAKVYQAAKFTNTFDRNNWSSIIINLDEDLDTILKNLRSDHRRSIKKAEKANLKIRHAESADDIKELAAIYHKMESFKKFDSHSIAHIESFFTRIYEFITKKDKGYVILVTDDAGKILGGIINVLQGKRVRIFKGGADPERKNVPLMHTAVFESIKIAKSMGIPYLDLWGYNHYVGPDDQIHNINLFKQGFGGRFIFYPKIMHFQIFPFGRFVYNLLMKIKKKTTGIFPRKISSCSFLFFLEELSAIGRLCF